MPAFFLVVHKALIMMFVQPTPALPTIFYEPISQKPCPLENFYAQVRDAYFRLVLILPQN